MTMKVCKPSILLFFVWAAVTLAPSLHAQSGAVLAIGQNMTENTAKLEQYTFKQKVEFYLKGELKKTMVSQVHFDSNGQRVSVPLESTPAAGEAQQHRGPMARKMAEQKKDEMKDYVERLVGLMNQYFPPSEDKIKDAAKRAEFGQPAPGQAAAIFYDYLKTGDSMTLTLLAAEKRISEIAVKTSLDSDPVSIVVDMSQLPDETNYPATTNLKSDAKQVELRISTYDYQPLSK